LETSVPYGKRSNHAGPHSLPGRPSLRSHAATRTAGYQASFFTEVTHVAQKLRNAVSLRADNRVHSTPMVLSNMTFAPERSTHGSGFRVHPPADDWLVLLAAQPNVLLSGPRDATHAFILAVTPYLREPVRCSVAGDALLSLPATDGTMILRDVDALDHEQQQQFLHWLDDPQNGRTQVVSITAAPLYAAVRTGTFLERLYYRLNVTHFEVISD
jgi:hypothetical protein